jgi:hypothetical protein
MDTVDGKYERSYEYMEEAVPVSDLRIIAHGMKVASVKTLREGTSYSVRVVGSETQITLARVALWEVVQISVQRVE